MSTLKDLNKHLFYQLDRLANADANSLDAEIQRAESIQAISSEVIKAHTLQLNAVKLVAEYKGLNPNQKTPQISCDDMNVEV